MFRPGFLPYRYFFWLGLAGGAAGVTGLILICLRGCPWGLFLEPMVHLYQSVGGLAGGLTGFLICQFVRDECSPDRSPQSWHRFHVQTTGISLVLTAAGGALAAYCLGLVLLTCN